MKLNKEYKEIARDILEDKNYELLKNDVHHGSNRYAHCKRVAYLSYLMAKLFKGNCHETVRAGLLHDFFYGNTHDVENSYFNHPKTSINNAKEYFQINKNEEDIIKTHMYHYALLRDLIPFGKKEVKSKELKPTSKEGKIVCFSDLLVSVFECGIFKVRYSLSLYLIFIINNIRY